MDKENKTIIDTRTKHQYNDKLNKNKNNKSKKILVRLNLTRPWELDVCRKIYVFSPLEEKELPEKILNDPNWNQHKKYFSVRNAE